METVKCKIDVLAKVLMAGVRAYKTELVEFSTSNDKIYLDIEIHDSFLMTADKLERMNKHGIKITTYRKSGIKPVLASVVIPCVACNKTKRTVEVEKELFDFLMLNFIDASLVLEEWKCRVESYDINSDYFVKYVFAKGDFSFCEIPAAVNDFLKGIGMAVGISAYKDGTFELIIKQAYKAQF